jgi:hypothetical protein
MSINHWLLLGHAMYCPAAVNNVGAVYPHNFSFWKTGLNGFQGFGVVWVVVGWG